MDPTSGAGFRGIPLEPIAARVGTPFLIYDAAEVRERIARLKEAIAGPHLQARYAMKACSAHRVLHEARQAGLWIDAVSGNEVLRARAAGFAAGFSPPEVVLTTDVFRDNALEAVLREPVLPCLGSPRMLDDLSARGFRGPIGLRINPGFGHGHVRACDTGGPSSKHGLWPDEEARVRRSARDRGPQVVFL